MELLNCPFCGGKAELKHSGTWGAPNATSVRIICARCRTATMPIAEGFYNQYGGRKNVHVTLEEAEADTIMRWNTRTEGAA